MKRVELRPEAEAEIADAAKWYDQESPGLGVSFIRAVQGALATIAEQPAAFSPIGLGARRFVVRKFPYGIIYRQEGDVIVVYSCFHGHRNPKEWRKRL